MKHNFKELIENWHERIFDKESYVKNFEAELRQRKQEQEKGVILRAKIYIDEILGDDQP